MHRLYSFIFGIILFFSFTSTVYADFCAGYQSGDKTHTQQQGTCLYYSADTTDNFSTKTGHCDVITCNQTHFPDQDTCTYMANKSGLKGNYHIISDDIAQCGFNYGGPYYCCAPDVQPSPAYPPAPCTSGKDPKTCVSVNTGIGSISVNPATLAGNIVGVLLGISGGIATIIIIISGYRIIFAQGDPEKLQAARDSITSAIIGLLFIIFSVVILRVIGVDILHLPGLNP